MDVPELPEIKTERVTDSVHRELRNLIVSRRIKPGQKLTTEDLAGRFGVSRSPVHEALVLLASEGLVEIVPRKGTFVTDLTLEDIVDTMDVRRALEVLACETAVSRATKRDIAELRRLADEIERTALYSPDTQEGESRHGASNLAFHQMLVDLSANRVLIEMYRRLNAHMKMARAHIDTWHDRLGQERAEHDGIVEALAAKDLQRLTAAVDNHLRRSTHSLLLDLRAAQRREPRA